MTKINNIQKYIIKKEPNINDYIIGTDSQNNNKTKNFLIGDILSLQSNINTSSFSYNYLFSEKKDISANQGYFSTNNVSLNNVSIINVNKINVVNTDLTDIFTIMQNNSNVVVLKLSDGSVDNFGYYKVNSISNNIPTVFQFNVTPIQTVQTGSFVDENNYIFNLDVIKISEKTSDLINDGEDGNNSFITLNDVPNVPEYNLTLSANILTLTKDGAPKATEDLSLYLDDTNLARLTSGVLNPTTGLATFTRDDNTTFTLDLSNLLDGDVDWLKQIDDTLANTITDAIYTKGNVSIGDVTPVIDGTSNTGNLHVDGQITLRDKLYAGSRHSSWGITIESEESQNGAVKLVARGNNVTNSGFNFEQQGNFWWTFWNYLSEPLLRMTEGLVQIFKPLRLSNVPTGNINTDQMLTIDTSGNVNKVTPELGGAYSFKRNGTGYYEIKVPYEGTNFSIKFSVYRHGNGLAQYHVTGYLNSPNGWIQVYVTKTSQSGNSTETITLTDNGIAGDFKIYVGDGTLNRNISTLFITEVLLSGISGASSAVGGLSVFPVSIQSTITGTVKGTF